MMAWVCILAFAPPDSPRVIPSATDIPLSGHVVVTVEIPGVAPVRVVRPDPILQLDSYSQWKVTPLGDAEIKDNRIWTQQWRLEPFVFGDAVPVVFGEFEVFEGQQTVPRRVPPTPIHIKVTTLHAKSTARDALPHAGHEDPPVERTLKANNRIGLWVGLIVAAVLTYVWLSRKKPTNTAKAPRARDLLLKLNPTTARPDDVVRILKGFAVEQFGPQTVADTTTQLLDRVTFQRTTWETVLHACDAARFSGKEWTPEERSRVLELVRTLVNFPSENTTVNSTNGLIPTTRS
jgi:hypothetical protein